MVSRCCGREVFLIHSESDYYECARCGRPCDLKESKNESQLGNSVTRFAGRYYATVESPWWLASLPSKRHTYTKKYVQLVRPRPRTCVGFNIELWQ